MNEKVICSSCHQEIIITSDPTEMVAIKDNGTWKYMHADCVKEDS